MRDVAGRPVPRSARAWCAAGALAVLPLAVLVDFQVAYRGGWRIDTLLERGVVILSAAVPGILALALALPRGRRWLARRLPALGLLAGSTAFALLVSEGVLHLTTRPLESFRRFHRKEPGSHFVMRPEPSIMPGVQGDADYHTDAWGLRGVAPLPGPDDTRLLCIGGSTTICQYLDDRETWPYLLAERLNAAGGDRHVWVGNAGKNGYSAVHHLRLLEIGDLLPEIDCAVVLVGVNDLSLALSGNQVRFRDGLPPLWRRSRWMETLTWLVQAGQSRDRLEVEDEAGEVYARRRKSRQEATIEDELPDLTAALAEYSDRVRRMVQILRQHDVRPVFLSQPVLWDRDLDEAQRALLWFGNLGQNRFLAVPALREGMDAFNGALRRTCLELEVDHVDLDEMNGVAEYYYDDCHFTEAGARKVAELVARFLLERGLASDPDAALRQP